jgi:hypothetical protein
MTMAVFYLCGLGVPSTEFILSLAEGLRTDLARPRLPSTSLRTGFPPCGGRVFQSAINRGQECPRSNEDEGGGSRAKAQRTPS